jgi:hypothetical protein
MNALDNIRLCNIFPCAIIGIEATGPQSCSHPIEIAVVTTDNRRYEALIRPVPEWSHWDNETQQRHGISRQRLVLEGTDIRLVCSRLNDLCWRQTLYCDAWAHYSRWLQVLFAAAGMPMKFSCLPLDNLLTEVELQHWTERRLRCHQALHLPPYRAMNDALTIAVTVDQLLSERALLQRNPASFHPGAHL